MRAEFKRRGLSVSEWARRRGVSAGLTYQILAGRKVGQRGQSHQIAVLLGLKQGLIDTDDDLRFVFAPLATSDAPEGKEEHADKQAA